MNTQTNVEILFLKTALFQESSEITNAVQKKQDINTETLELNPAEMADADWDHVITRALQAKKIITL